MNSLKRPMASVCALLLLSSVPAAHAASDGYAFIEGFGVQDDDRPLENKTLTPGVRLGLGSMIGKNSMGRASYNFNVFTNKIILKNGESAGNQGGLMLDFVQGFGSGGIQPFVFGGVGMVREKLGPVSDVFPAVEAGVGALTAVTSAFNVYASLSAQDVFDRKAVPDKDSFIDYRVALGIVVPFSQAPPPPPPKPADADGDGVPDASDKCPTTPAATADGCPPPAPVVEAAPPRDTDGDGIDDAVDTCPGTLGGLKVDDHGCVSAAAQSIVLKGVNFVPGSAELTPEAKGALDKAADALRGQAALKVEIGGHTDSTGDPKKNTALSQARAESVKKYLAGKGVDAGRLGAKGYGSSQPIADNKTKDGRAQNRRVELKVLQ